MDGTDRAEGGRGTDRRAWLAGAAAVSLASPLALLPAPAHAAPANFGPLGRPAWAPDGLMAAAAARGLAYGCEVVAHRLHDPAYRAAVAREAGLLVCGTETKMEVVLAQAGRPDFAPGDAILRFARGNGQRMRGHTLVWHEGLPAWVRPRLAGSAPAQAEDFLRRWIETVAGHYRGAIEAWDVINEGIAGDGGEGLRPSPWLAALGPGYPDLAFRILHETDPKAAGTWNEDAVEQASPVMAARRTAILRRLEAMRGRGVPVARFGMQAHLTGTVPLDETALRRFLAEIGALGLGVEITELDVDDRAFPADTARRDAGVADLARRFLDVVLDEPAVLNVVTWGLDDRETWLNEHPLRRRPDGLPQRPLPLDAAYRRKPLWQALHRALRGAPDHRAARARLRG